MTRIALSVVTGVVAALALAGCAAAQPDADSAAPSAEASHDGGGVRDIHGLDLDEATGFIHIGTHDGLLVAGFPHDGASVSEATRLGDYRGDVMGLVRVGETLLISGHSNPADGGHGNVGVLRSDLTGAEWEPLSLEGEVDFHSMVAGGASASSALIAGLDSATGQVFVSPDGGEGWQQGARLAARSLAWNADASALFATTEEGLQVSTDRGSSFAVVSGAPPLVLLASSPAGASSFLMAGIDVEGVLHTSTDGQVWTAQSAVPIVPGAIAVGETGAIIIADTSGVLHSTDAGATWTRIVAF